MLVVPDNKGILFIKEDNMGNLIDYRDGRYFFQGREISRRQSQKIKYGNWAGLTSEQIHRKLDNKIKRKEIIAGYEIIYEELLKTRTGAYALGIAQEKVVNAITKLLQKLKKEARRLVKNNRNKLPENIGV